MLTSPPISLRCARLLVAVVLLSSVASAAEPVGEQVYRKQCSRCHGPTGEGTKKAPQPLVGEKSAVQLAPIIAKTMPEDNPGSCTASDAAAVARYIHEAFYSSDAQARIKPPRVELARLTVRQYRNAVADLVGGFRPDAKPDPRSGIRGEYFNDRRFVTEKRLLDRVDPEVRFDFKSVGPAEKFDPDEFSIRWEGSVVAPQTGTFDFVVRTEHAARLWVNDPRKPLIDAWVKSGTDAEFRGSIFLLGGRTYYLKLEFSKARQGVKDPKGPKPKPTAATVSLAWKPPHGVVGVIPSRFLSPGKVPEFFVPETPFPPDDRSLGWVRGTAVSKEWDQATTEAALETANYIAARLPELAGSSDAAKLRDFAARFAERAFRRPLTAEQKKLYLDRAFVGAKDSETAIKRFVLFVLKSPRFLYREVGSTPDALDTAARLSFALWDSAPDQLLLDAAKAGKLGTRAEVEKQAERMLADPRAKAKLREFVLQWLQVNPAADVAKDTKRFPGFDPNAIADLRASLDLFIDDVLWSNGSDFRRLLLEDGVFLNGRLAKLYGASLPADAGFQKVTLDPGKRAGVLTHPYLMSAFAYTASSSPIHRGVFLARGVLGLSLRPPQEAFTPLPEDLHPSLTTRERVALQTRGSNCQGCHNVINPLGFTLEHFDAIGRYREKDNGKTVDDDGSYMTRGGRLVKFDGVRELATFLANSEEVHAAFAEQLFHHLVQQPVRAYGVDRLEVLRKSFAVNKYDIRKLAVEVTVTAALVPRTK